jgi:hypothetical protein
MHMTVPGVSQANDGLVRFGHRAGDRIYGGGRCLVLHAWPGSAYAAAPCAGSERPLIIPGQR